MSHCSKNKSGFTLIELLVSITIVSIILGVLVWNQRSYTDTAALASLADDLSLTVSQAQAYGIAVRELTIGSSDFTASYGLTLSLLGTGSNSAYLFFADRNDNDYYDGAWTCPVGGASECLEKVNIPHSNYIDSICVVVISGADQCNTASRIDILFVRPETEARMTFFNSSGGVFVPASMKGVRIVLKSPAGATRSVIVYKTGQISVQ
ncbi:MAG: type II secretion system protein [bacterium]|nr:type II secretion system protein [bacterium]